MQSTNVQEVLYADDQNVHETGAAGGIFMHQSSRKKEPIPMVAPDQVNWIEIKKDLPEPVIINDNDVHEIGSAGGIFVLESSRMKEFNLKLKPATSASDYQNGQNADVHETGTGGGVLVKESEKENNADQSIPEVPDFPKSDKGDVHEVGTGIPIPNEQDDYLGQTKESKGEYHEIANAGGVFIKESQSIGGEDDLIKQPFPDLPKGIVATSKVPSGSNRDSTFNIFRLNPADIAQAITSTVMKILAEININVNKNPAITNWPVKFVGRANEMIDTKAKIAKRMVKEVGNFATGTMHNLDSLAAGAELIAALNKN